MNKEAATRSAIGAGAKFAGSLIKGLATTLGIGYQQAEKLAWYAVPTVTILGTLGAIRALRPEAVAANADKLLLQETLTSSLAKSIRKYDQMNKDKALADSYNTERRHDRFI